VASPPTALRPRSPAQLAIRPLRRREYRVAVEAFEEIIGTFPWGGEHDRGRAAATAVLAALTVAICDYEESSWPGRLRARLAAPAGRLPLAVALACYPGRLRSRARAPGAAGAARTRAGAGESAGAGG
jgi:hypothetical protein